MGRADTTTRDRVLLREDPLASAASGLATRIERLGFQAELVPDDERLRRLLAPLDRPRALLVNVALGGAAVRTAAAIATEPTRAPEVTVIGVGPPADPPLRESLRQAGVTLAAFGPIDDTTLRFQINRAFLRARPPGPARQELRAPIGWEAGLRDERPRFGCRLANLSRGGAFVQMARPLAAGRAVQLEVPLPSGPVRLDAVVRHANPPGALRQRRAPVGMGVTFTRPDPGVWRRIDQVLSQRSADLFV